MQVTENLLTDDISLYNVRIIRDTPIWIEECVVDFESYSHDIDGGIKYLLVDEQYYLDGNKVIMFGRSMRQPINMQGVEECSKFLVEFNPSYHELYINKILVIRNDKIIDKLDTADMQVLRREYKAESNILSGDRTLSIILEDIKANDVIVFIYTIVNCNSIDVRFFSKQLQLEYGVPVHKIHLVFIIMDNIDIQYKFLCENYGVGINKSGDKKVYTFCRKNIPAKKFQQYIPYWYRLISLLQIAIKKDWKDIAYYVAQYYKVEKLEEEVLAGFKTEMNEFSHEKTALKILSFINKNIRYLSNFKVTDFIKPSNPNMVIKRGYGDCKDLVHLFHCILSVFGIHSYPVLVHTRYGKGLRDVLPSPSVFDHVIILVLVNGERYFIDPTIRQDVELLEYIYLPDYGYGLACQEASENLIYIENRLSSPSYISIKDEYHISSWEKNEVVFRSSVTMQGESALRLMRYMENGTEENLFESMQKFYARFVKIKEVVDSKLDVTHSKFNKIIYTVEYRISLNVLVEEKKKYTMEVIPMDILEKIYHNLPTEMDSDFYYGPNIKIDYCIDIIDPKITFTGRRKLEVSNNFFSLVKTSKGRKGCFLFNYQFEKLKDVVPSEKYKEFYLEHERALSILPASVLKYKSFKLSKFIITCLIYFVIILIFQTINHFFR